VGAKSPVAGIGVENLKEAFKLTAPEVTRLGEDILLESEVIACSQE
ncbi:MAG TPA: riboflavin biosynthesis protein RibD, partial [Ruminococcaceae bacterium]|nr:riboflavin biosynthesis protein RibD [Oscillospiraceae bacterium]